MKSMGDMSMGGMIKQCHEHHHAMTQKMDEASKTLEEAKQSNDLAKVRAAIDQAQKQLAEMKEHMNMCGTMMHMMEKMQGMGGMMKGDSK
jgi:phage shock protein A